MKTPHAAGCRVGLGLRPEESEWYQGLQGFRAGARSKLGRVRLKSERTENSHTNVS